MPRIAAAIGVFAAIAVFTFINIKSYPVVWEMVGSSPWFTQQAQSTPQPVSTQPESDAEDETPQPAPPQPELKSLADSEHLPVDHPTTKTDDSTLTVQSQSGGGSVYPGLNLEPIKVSPTSPQDTRWPAAMSPTMKYAAKPPIADGYQNLNPERPLVPVEGWEGGQSPFAANGDCPPLQPRKSLDNSTPAADDSSRVDAPAEKGEASDKEDKEVVRRLPPVDPEDPPIRMSISADDPIPVYPSTGRQLLFLK